MPKFPCFSTPRLSLREFCPEDAAALFRLRSDPVVMRFMDREPLLSLAQASDLAQDSMAMWPGRRGIFWAAALAEDPAMIGYAGFHKWRREDFCAELAYALAPNFHRKGLISEALIPIIDFAFGPMNLHRIEASVNPDNTASIAVLEKLAFQREGCYRENLFFRGRFLDTVIYARLAPKPR